MTVHRKRRRSSKKYSPKESLSSKPLPPPKPKRVSLDLELDAKGDESDDEFHGTSDTEDEVDTTFLLPQRSKSVEGEYACKVIMRVAYKHS